MKAERRENKISLAEVVSDSKEITFRDGVHVPSLIVEGSKKLIVAPIPNMPATHGEQITYMRFLGEAALREGEIGRLQQVFIITEEWQKPRIKGKPVEVQPTKPLITKEILVISALQIKERKKYRKHFEIVRGHDHQVVSLKELLPDDKGRDRSVKIPLVEAFVKGFRTAFQTKNN